MWSGLRKACGGTAHQGPSLPPIVVLDRMGPACPARLGLALREGLGWGPMGSWPEAMMSEGGPHPVLGVFSWRRPSEGQGSGVPCGSFGKRLGASLGHRAWLWSQSQVVRAPVPACCRAAGTRGSRARLGPLPVSVQGTRSLGSLLPLSSQAGGSSTALSVSWLWPQVHAPVLVALWLRCLALSSGLILDMSASWC